MERVRLEKLKIRPDSVLVEARLTKFFNKVLVVRNILKACRYNYVVLIFKCKGNVQECGYYKGIKHMKPYTF